jgi:MarR-like DNA-binding transcriptional regulator SgrR of sgrS sRNA
VATKTKPAAKQSTPETPQLTGNRAQRRKQLAEMTEAQRAQVVPANMQAADRERFIKDGIDAWDAQDQARAAREAAEAEQETVTDGVTVKAAAAQMQVSKSKVRKIMRTLEISTPLTQDDIARIAEHTTTASKEETIPETKTKQSKKATAKKQPAKKVAAKKEQPTGVVTVADIAAEAGVDAKQVRKVLRAKGITKKDGTYQWPSLKNRTVQAVIKAVKA